MTIFKRALGAIAFSALTVAGSAAAQTTTSATTTTSAPSGTSLGITMNATPRISAGTPDALLALVILQAGTGSSIQTSSLPMSFTLGGGLTSSHLADCRVRNVNNLATPLNSNAPSIVSGMNTFGYSSPLTVGAGSTVTLAVTCDLATFAPVGSTITLSLTPSSVPATSGSTTVTPIVGFGVNGGSGPTSGSVLVTAPSVTPIPTVPGVPNTGARDPITIAILLISGALGLGAFAFLMRRREA